MAERYLEVTYRRGRPVAAYLFLPRRADDKSARTEAVAEGVLVDWAADGRPIGIEILAPGTASLEQLNAVLAKLSLAPLGADDLRPLVAA